jgi:Tfp pilus assembly protein PilF
MTRFPKQRIAFLIRSGILGIALPLATGCSYLGGGASEAPTPQLSVEGMASDEAARICIRAAQEFEINGYHAEAAIQYERARLFAPNPDILPEAKTIPRRLATLYSKLSKPREAQDEFEKALEIYPKDSKLWNDYGYFSYGLGEWNLAEEAFRKAVLLDETNERAYVNLGLTLAQQGRDEISLVYFQKALSPAKARCNLGLVQAQRGELEKARESLERALTEEPNLFDARDALALVNSRLSGEKNSGAETPEPLSEGSSSAPSDSAPNPTAEKEANAKSVLSDREG